MWRSVTSKVSFSKKITIPRKQKPTTRWQSTSSSSGSDGKGGKFVLTVAGATALGVAATVAYARYDKDFRKLLESNLPYGDVLFTYIPDWGSSSKPQEKTTGSSELVKDKAAEGSLLRKKQERESIKKPEEVQNTTPPVVTTPSITQSPPKPAVVPPVSKNADDDPAARRRLKQQEAEATAQNLALERNLRDCQQSAEQLSKDAFEAQKAAAAAIREHSEKLFKALDVNVQSDSDANQVEMWNDVNLALEAKMSALVAATEKAADAGAAIERLVSRIKNGKENKVTGNNAVLLTAEEAVEKFTHQVRLGETELKAAHSEARVATDYKDLLEKAKHQFQQELLAVMPDAKVADKDRKLTEEEMNFLIVHAHRRVEQLYSQLAKQQATEQQRLIEALEKRKVNDQQDLSLTISKELARQQRELNSDHQKEVGKMQETFELEMRQQLRRQAAAHSDHLQEVLQIQELELQRQHICNLEEKLLEQRGQQQAEVGTSMAKLKGIEGYLQAREELDKAAHKAQQLWLACHSLRQAIRVGRGQPKPLQDDVAAIREAAGQDDPLFSAVIASIPERALSRGVYTDENLKERYDQVESVCRRVAMIDENGGSLYRYLLSYMQSFFVLRSRTIPEAELNGDGLVDPKEWDTFDILTRVRYCLEHNQLERALRYANQLRGEPRNVARDWLAEMCLLLETRLAADTLIAQASATTLQAYN